MGTKITYLIQADAGGNIPSAISNSKGPSQARATVENVLTYIRSQKAGASAAQMSDADREQLVQQLKAKFDRKGDATDEQKAQEYGLYMQITKGNNTTERPGMISWGDTKAKWDEWEKCKGKSKGEALIAYIKLVRPLV